MKDEVKAIVFSFRLHPSAFILALALFTACGSRNNSQDKPADSSEINVAAAANLTDAFTELGKQFTAQAGIRIKYNFGSTADLEKQIENGAPFDVFAAA